MGDVHCCIALFTGLSSPEKLTVMALSLLEQEKAEFRHGAQLCRYLLTQSRIPTESTPITTRTMLVERLTNGLAVLLIDGCACAVGISTQEMPQRSVSNPGGEGNMHGPQEAFTEMLRSNVSLLRRSFAPQPLWPNCI